MPTTSGVGIKSVNLADIRSDGENRGELAIILAVMPRLPS